MASCASCGEVGSTSLLGLLLATPEARALRARHPRAHVRPTQVEGDRLVIGLRDPSTGAWVAGVYDETTSRLLRVVAGA